MTRISVGGGVFGVSLLVWGLFTLLTIRSDSTGSDLWMTGILLLVGFIFVIVGFAPKRGKKAFQGKKRRSWLSVEPGETAP